MCRGLEDTLHHGRAGSRGKRQLVTPQLLPGSRELGICHLFSSLFTQSENSAHHMSLRPHSELVFIQWPQTILTWRYVSMAILEPVKLTAEVNH